MNTTLKDFKPFNHLINFWTNTEIYNIEKRELDKQIKNLISLYSAVGQSSQGNPEDYKHMDMLNNDIKSLQSSISKALGI